jgi:hypothetical protein
MGDVASAIETVARTEVVDAAGAVEVFARLEIFDVAARRLAGVADEEDVVDMADPRAPEYIESARVDVVVRAK